MAEDTLLDALNADDAYKRYKNIVLTIRKRNDLKKDRDDTRILESTRKLPKMYDEAPTEMKLYQAIAKEIAIRASLTTIRGRLMVESSLLKKTLDDIGAHIRLNYQDWLEDFKRAEEQKQVVATMLRHGIGLREDIEATIGLIDFVIKDLDQANYSAGHMVRMFEKFTDPNRTPRYT